jgi:hypothetical protein
MNDNSVKEYKAIAQYEEIQKKRIADSWSPEQEQILKSWAEKGSGWAWLHDNSARFYLQSSNRLAYPGIFLSTIAGGISFSTAGSSTTAGVYAGYLTAVINIICAMLASFQKFTRSAEKSEIHLQQGKLFSSFCRKITLELALKAEDRKECIEFCKLCRDEYDKLVTESMQIPLQIIQDFKREFKNSENKPENCNGLVHFQNCHEKAEITKVHEAHTKMRQFYNWRERALNIKLQSFTSSSPRSIDSSVHSDYNNDEFHEIKNEILNEKGVDINIV